MYLDLTQLTENFPLEALRTLLQRACDQVVEDQQQFGCAISVSDFSRAAQLMHRMRGLALFVGVRAEVLESIQTLENTLSLLTPSHPTDGVGAMVDKFDEFCTDLIGALQSSLKQLAVD